MDVEPECIACHVKRTLICITPVANRHEMRSFECPKCSTVFRLVVGCEPRMRVIAGGGRAAEGARQ
jgi:hypothetical protein